MDIRQNGNHPARAERSARLNAPRFRINPVKRRRGDDQIEGPGNHLKLLEEFFANLYLRKPREVPPGNYRKFPAWLKTEESTARSHEATCQLACAAANLQDC